MPSRIMYTDQQLLDYSEEHLLYELQLFRWVAEKLPSNPGYSTSVLVESFAIHLRNLIEFLYTEPRNARNDDLVAADFFDSHNAWDPGAMPESLAEARERANKEVSHITYKRKSGTDPTKPWPVASLFAKIHAVSQDFAATASRAKLHRKVKEWLTSDPVTRGVLLVSASTSSTNTASSVVTWISPDPPKKTP